MVLLNFLMVDHDWHDLDSYSPNIFVFFSVPSGIMISSETEHIIRVGR